MIRFFLLVLYFVVEGLDRRRWRRSDGGGGGGAGGADASVLDVGGRRRQRLNDIARQQDGRQQKGCVPLH